MGFCLRYIFWTILDRHDAGRSASDTHQVNANITEVNQAVSATGQSSSEVLQSAQEPLRQSETLRSEVDKFLVEVRSA